MARDDGAGKTGRGVPARALSDDDNPRRLRSSEADDLDEGAGRDDGREDVVTRDPGADLDGLGMPDIAEDQVPGPADQQSQAEPIRESAPVEAPAGSLEWGTTAWEQAEGEPLDGRLAREEPDTLADPALADAAAPSVGPGSQLVQPDEGARPDRVEEEVGEAVGDLPDERLAAEESAVRVEPDR
jgi:hypothetical protein